MLLTVRIERSMHRLSGIYVRKCPSVKFFPAKLIGWENKMIFISRHHSMSHHFSLLLFGGQTADESLFWSEYIPLRHWGRMEFFEFLLDLLISTLLATSSVLASLFLCVRVTHFKASSLSSFECLPLFVSTDTTHCAARYREDGKIDCGWNGRLLMYIFTTFTR